MSTVFKRIRVLCLSRDPHLLRTRGMVLGSRYEVELAASVEEMSQLAAHLDFDVIILCHSLASEECDLAMSIAGARWPAAKIVALSVERSSCSDYADHVIRGMDGPRMLLSTIDQLVASSL